MASYEIVAVGRTPTSSVSPVIEVLGPIAGALTYSESLNEAPMASVTVSVDSLQDNIKDRIRDPMTYPMEIWVYRDSVLVFRGPLVTGVVDGATVTLEARGMEFYLSYMLAKADKSWAATDWVEIVEELMDEWQIQTWADFGVISGATNIGVTTTLAMPFLQEPMTIYDFVLEQSGRDSFDFWVDPTNEETQFATARGSDLSATVFLERGVSSPAVRFSVAPGIIASEVYASGSNRDTDNTYTTVRSNTSVRETFGRSGVPFSEDQVDSTTRLQEIADKVLDDSDAALFVPGPGMIPVAGAEVTDFGIGDTVTYTYNAGLGQQTGAFRVVKRSVTVDELGREPFTVEFE